ncbi:MAG: protein-export membrane protein SecF [uncultured bacterium]|nr:MAG: protein-export membrane protein SecF [uncultured bacterium]
MYNIIGKRKIFFVLSAILVIGSIAGLSIFGFNLGIDFTGGSLLEVNMPSAPAAPDIESKINDMDLGKPQVQPAGENNYLIRTKEFGNDVKNDLLGKLRENFGDVEEMKFDTVGPTIGKELREKAVYAIVIILIAIAFYIAYAFRKVSDPVASWKFGVCAIIALVHDVIITVGVFVFLGRFMGVEIDTLFVVALLTLLGYSVNDTIIVFDRVRDKLLKGDRDFERAANSGVNDTLVRSLNTSLTTLLAILAIFLFGGETIKYFILALIVGISVGTYSSIFVATAVLVEWQKAGRKR